MSIERSEPGVSQYEQSARMAGPGVPWEDELSQFGIAVEGLESHV